MIVNVLEWLNCFTRNQYIVFKWIWVGMKKGNDKWMALGHLHATHEGLTCNWNKKWKDKYKGRQGVTKLWSLIISKRINVYDCFGN